jgi:hypothetical protein
MSFVMEKRPGEDQTGDQLATAQLTEAVRGLTLSTIRLARLVSGMPGASRPEIDHIAADLMDVAKMTGLQHPDAPNPRPRSAWPEGTPEDDDAI